MTTLVRFLEMERKVRGEALTMDEVQARIAYKQAARVAFRMKYPQLTWVECNAIVTTILSIRAR